MLEIIGGILLAITAPLYAWHYISAAKRLRLLEQQYAGHTVIDALRALGRVVIVDVPTEDRRPAAPHHTGTFYTTSVQLELRYCGHCQTYSAKEFFEAIEVPRKSILGGSQALWQNIGIFCCLCGECREESFPDKGPQGGLFKDKLAKGDNLLDILAVIGNDGSLALKEEHDRRLSKLERETEERLIALREKRAAVQNSIAAELPGPGFRGPARLTAVPSK